MVAEDIIRSWDSLKTCELMEKLFLSYQCIRPWSNMEYCDGINNFSNSARPGSAQTAVQETRPGAAQVAVEQTRPGGSTGC
jgi:hypothetical protein